MIKMFWMLKMFLEKSKLNIADLVANVLQSNIAIGDKTKMIDMLSKDLYIEP